MMYNREAKDYPVIRFTNAKDNYGQERKKRKTDGVVNMVAKLRSEAVVNDVRFLDVDLIGLTKDKTIADKNLIEIDGNYYEVLYIIPSDRYNQIMMKKSVYNPITEKSVDND